MLADSARRTRLQTDVGFDRDLHRLSDWQAVDLSGYIMLPPLEFASETGKRENHGLKK
tara:strand:- start:731 stop:904 length:174 start_codon:yes stop_codon:yes gene_type:complete